MFDTHCHLDDARFDGDRAAVIAALPECCVTVGSDIASSKACLALAEKSPRIYAACGVHPHEAKDAAPDYLDTLTHLLRHERAVALGEIGLDYYYDLSPRDVQMRVMQEQIDLAQQLDKPVIFHIRDAHGDMLEVFRSRAVLPRGIIHCFSGSAEVAAEYVKMGFYISFAGPVTFKNAPNLWAACKVVPLSRLLAETDSPYLAPQPVRGKRNEPQYVRFVLQKMAELHDMSMEEMEQITTKNAMKFYGIWGV